MSSQGGWKWTKKWFHFPIISLFMFFIMVTMLYNELKIQHFSNIHNFSPGLAKLNRMSTCNYTRKYSGREVEWRDKSNRRPPVRGGGRSKSKSKLECDVFSGKWVLDNTSSYPLYEDSECPYIDDQLACQRYGRLDSEYQYLRWQPNHCNLKRWNVTEMWEKLRGKRLMFVGDSLSRGQWFSMVCLLQSVIPPHKKSMTPKHAHLRVFRVEEYNASIEYLWSPYLVESNSDDPNDHRFIKEHIIHPDDSSRHRSIWEKADILVFDTYLWWTIGPVKLWWSDEEDVVCEELEGPRAMELAMKTWAKWVDSIVDPLKKRVFFVTMSPTHFKSQEWNASKDGNCYGETKPIEEESYSGSASDKGIMRMVDDILSRLATKAQVINITQLSEYRKDGHPSTYRFFRGRSQAKKWRKPESYSDCAHWCLPGVPDIWNQFIFHFL